MEEGRIHYLPLPVPSITTTIVFLLRELVHLLVVHEVPLGNAQVVQRVRVLEVVWAELALPVAAGALKELVRSLSAARGGRAGGDDEEETRRRRALPPAPSSSCCAYFGAAAAAPARGSARPAGVFPDIPEGLHSQTAADHLQYEQTSNLADPLPGLSLFSSESFRL